MNGREAICAAGPNNMTREVQESRHRTVEQRLETLRTYGDTMIAAFLLDR